MKINELILLIITPFFHLQYYIAYRVSRSLSLALLSKSDKMTFN